MTFLSILAIWATLGIIGSCILSHYEMRQRHYDQVIDFNGRPNSTIWMQPTPLHEILALSCICGLFMFGYATYVFFADRKRHNKITQELKDAGAL